MTRKRRKRFAIAGLVALLGLWIGVQHVYTEERRALYERQSLAVMAVEIQSGQNVIRAPSPEQPLRDGTPAEVVEALREDMDFVASCFMTDDGTRAPVRVDVALGVAGELVEVSVGELDDPDDADESCVLNALERVEWPAFEGATTIGLELADRRPWTRLEWAQKSYPE